MSVFSCRFSDKLILAIALAFLAGCGADKYSIERQYYKTQKQAEKIFANPHASPENELERVVGEFNNFIQKYPNDILSVDAEFSIARLFIAKEEYEKAREHLKATITKHASSEIVCSEAMFLLGNSYQTQDKWDMALEQYKGIVQKYPVTPKGLDVPVYIAGYYKTKYQPDKMIGAYKEAIEHYKSLAGTYQGSPLGYRLDILTAACYGELKDWGSAIDVFDDIIKNYKDKITLDEVMINKALIYKNELKDNDKAKEEIEGLIKDYPRSRFIKIAQNMLKELK